MSALADPFDARRAGAATGLLRVFNDARVFAPRGPRAGDKPREADDLGRVLDQDAHEVEYVVSVEGKHARLKARVKS